MSDKAETRNWEPWLPRVAVACAILVPVLLFVTFSIHVSGDRCQPADPNRSGLAERKLLWTLALVVSLTGIGISILGLWRRRWSWGFALAGFVGELAIVLIAALGIDPCGLS